MTTSRKYLPHSSAFTRLLYHPASYGVPRPTKDGNIYAVVKNTTPMNCHHPNIDFKNFGIPDASLGPTIISQSDNKSLSLPLITATYPGITIFLCLT